MSGQPAPTLLMTRRRLTFGLGAAGLASLLPRRAASATEVRAMAWQGYEKPLGARDFLKQNNVTLQTTYVSSNEDILTKLLAGGMGSIDLGTPEIKYVDMMLDAGVLEAMDAARVPNIGRIMPFFRDQARLRRDGKTYAVPFTWGTQPMLYRPDLVKETPTSWLDVIKPEHKGKVVMGGSLLGNISIWAKVVTGAPVATHLTAAQLKETIDFLIKVKKEHARTVAASFGEMTDILARGDAVISTIGWEPVVQWVKKKGATLAMVYPKEGTTGFIDTYVVPRKAPNYELNLRLINHALSAEAQAEFAREMGQGIVNVDAIAALPPTSSRPTPTTIWTRWLSGRRSTRSRPRKRAART